MKLGVRKESGVTDIPKLFLWSKPSLCQVTRHKLRQPVKIIQQWITTHKLLDGDLSRLSTA